jgi:hypothetical protein
MWDAALKQADEHPNHSPVLEHAGRGVVRGSLEELIRAERTPELEHVAGILAKGATRAVRDDLRAELEAYEPSVSTKVGPLVEGVSTSASRSAARAIAAEAMTQLGPDGDGPLSSALTALVQKSTASAVQTAEQQMMTGCTDHDPARCTEQRIRDLSRASGAGFVDGALQSLRLPLFLLAFVLGSIVTVLVTGLVRRRAVRPS